MSAHLTPEEFFEFIDQGGGSGPAECLYMLDLILLADVPATVEEEAVLRRLPKRTREQQLEQLRGRIASLPRSSPIPLEKEGPNES